MKTIIYAASDRHGYRLGYLSTIKQTAAHDYLVTSGDYWKPSKHDNPVSINDHAARFSTYRAARQWSHEQAARAGYPQIWKEY